MGLTFWKWYEHSPHKANGAWRISVESPKHESWAWALYLRNILEENGYGLYPKRLFQFSKVFLKQFGFGFFFFKKGSTELKTSIKKPTLFHQFCTNEETPTYKNNHN